MQSDTVGKSKAGVPIPIYRELAAELQAAQAKIVQLQQQNDRLTRQNQALQEELQAILSAHNQTHMVVLAAQDRLNSLFPPPQTGEEQEIVIDPETEVPPEAVVAQTVAPTPVPMTESVPLNRTWLILLVAGILIVSFGAGYFLIKAGQKR
ncbi:MAG: hypothetical protein RMK91_03135 [Pseudanabaenaceae cyanobacterium SKYGB_i_bin29]|nr:hypothetical protein [Pseudanabaenaceae cyanobacterium SKYG29]MDW8420837.1 hypothetical protein [Pseudanabaenaceae cyanobacterium SKYGB_i_bin29]